MMKSMSELKKYDGGFRGLVGKAGEGVRELAEGKKGEEKRRDELEL